MLNFLLRPPDAWFIFKEDSFSLSIFSLLFTSSNESMNLKSLSRPPLQLSVQGRDLTLEGGSLLNYCQRAYRLGMAQLKWRHWNGADAERTTVGRSVILDQLIQTLWNAITAEQSLVGDFKRATWIALGEYGRL